MKTVLFYKGHLQDIENVRDVTSDIKEVFESILRNNKKPSLEIDTGGKTVFLDILMNDDSYLFGRLGKEKDSRTVGIRNITTMEHSPVLTPSDFGLKMLESSTYFLLVYENAVIAFMNGQDAPKVNSLIYAISNYSKKHQLFINAIARPESVKALFKRGSILSKISYTIEVPSLEALHTAGLSRNQISKLSETDASEIDIVIRSKPRKPLSADNDTIKESLNTFFPEIKGGKYRKVTAEGREPDMKTQKYSFDESNLQYGVEVSESKIEGGVRRPLSQDEIINDIYCKLVDLYIKNRRDLLDLIN